MRNIAKEVHNSVFRENQIHFFNFFMEHKNHNIIADAPTGIGKSLIAIQIAINWNVQVQYSLSLQQKI